METTFTLAFVLLPSLAFGQSSFPDGNSLIKPCHDVVRMMDGEQHITVSEGLDAARCRGYVHGVLEILSFDKQIGTVTEGKTPDDNAYPSGRVPVLDQHDKHG
jgi:hypothetical protein